MPDDERFKKLGTELKDYISEVLTHKETASSALFREVHEDIKALKQDIQTIQDDITKIERKWHDKLIDIEHEAEKKHQDINHALTDNHKEITAQKKIMATVATAIGLSVLYAVLKNIGL